MEFPIKIAIPSQGKYTLFAICKSNTAEKDFKGHFGEIFWIQYLNKGIKTDNLWYIGEANNVPENAIIGEMSSETEIKDKYTTYEDYTFKPFNKKQ